MRLNRFQRDVVEEVLAEGQVSGGWQVCRGNAKSTLTAGIGLWAVCDYPDAPVVPLIAHDGKHAERTLFRPMRRMIRLSDELAGRLSVYTAAGDKRVHSWWNDGDLMPLPADEDALQGLVPTLAIIDEAQTVPWGVYWAIHEGFGKRPDGAIISIGTPGRDLDCALYRYRKLVADGGAGAWIEMAAPAGCAVDDREAWRIANPAIRAGFLSEDVIAREARAALLDPDVEQSFRMYRLGQWPDGGAPLDPFSRHLRACEDAQAVPSGQLVFAADIGPTGGDACIVVASTDGVIEVVERHAGTAWLPERLLELVERHGGSVVVDGGGPIGLRLVDMTTLMGVQTLTGQEMARASARFAEDVEAERLRVRPSVELRAAVAGAQRFGQGDSWRFARRRSTTDIAPLVAATAAWWIAATTAAPGIH